MSLPAGSITGAVLAGGRSRRMGGGFKAMVDLAGQPMMSYVIDRLSPQVSQILISVQEEDAEFAAFDATLVPDRIASHRGPLAGLLSSLEYMQRSLSTEWLLLCPCDAPFLPPDLASVLAAAALADNRPVSAASYGDHPQPVFSLWHLDTVPVISEALEVKGEGGLMKLLGQCGASLAVWPEDDIPPFFNVNTPAELEQAKRWLDPTSRQA